LSLRHSPATTYSFCDRAGADIQVTVHVPLYWLRQADRGSAIEQPWISAGLGEPGYLAGNAPGPPPATSELVLAGYRRLPDGGMTARRSRAHGACD
jgi:hypothetical protein